MPATSPSAHARPRAFRLLVHDPDEARAAAIAHRARRAGHLVAVEPTPDGLRRAVLEGTWDAVAVEILGGSVASPFLLLELRHSLRRRSRPMPPSVVYVRDVLAGHDAAIARLTEELGPGVDCVRSEDPERVVRALERAASGREPTAAGREPAAIPVMVDPGPREAVPVERSRVGVGPDPYEAPTPASGRPSSSVAGSRQAARPSPASNWRR